MQEETNNKFAQELLTAIARHCLECRDGDAMGVDYCDDPSCPLYNYRLGNKNAKKETTPGKSEVL